MFFLLDKNNLYLLLSDGSHPDKLFFLYVHLLTSLWLPGSCGSFFGLVTGASFSCEFFLFKAQKEANKIRHEIKQEPYVHNMFHNYVC